MDVLKASLLEVVTELESMIDGCANNACTDITEMQAVASNALQLVTSLKDKINALIEKLDDKTIVDTKSLHDVLVALTSDDELIAVLLDEYVRGIAPNPLNRLIGAYNSSNLSMRIGVKPAECELGVTDTTEEYSK